MSTAARANVAIRRWLEIPDADRLTPAIDKVFFESSLTRSFADAAARSAFRERWLGRYLEHDPQFAYVALDGEKVAGYLVGSLDDPATTKRFCDIAVPAFAGVTAKFPAHLHVNLAADYRNGGLGGRLIAAFIADLKRRHVAGVHVVTGLGARNVGFYNRNGFLEVARARVGAHDLVLLGRRLAGPQQETA
jgi:ribosomal protein S18 acetylase RimI-like enzyme